MTDKKCKYKYGNREIEDENVTSAPFFKISSDVQLKEIPTNGEEYLLKVINERATYDDISTCTQDYSKFAKNQSYFAQEDSNPEAPDNLKHTIEWQNIQVADFSDVRMYVSRMLANKSSWPSKVKTLEIPSPETIDWKNFFEVQDPTLSCVLRMHQSLLDEGIETLIEMLEDIPRGDTIDHKTGQWIYALLACTRHPLLPDTISILRDLARKCLEIRSHINPEEDNAKEAVTPLNIFICLIARYFRQYDLAD